MQIKQSTRRGNKNINPILKTGNLWIDLDPSKHHIAAQRQVSAVSTHILEHLRSQLTRRRQHQNSHLSACSASSMSQPFQQRKREARCLAGASLCSCHHVATLDHGWDGLLLNR